MTTKRDSKLFSAVMKQVKPETNPPAPPPPTPLPNPRRNSRVDTYLEAADAHENVISACYAHLQENLEPELLQWVRTIEESARLKGRCEAMAQQATPENSRGASHIHFKLLHVLKRLNEHFNIVISLDVLKQLQTEWERQPVVYSDSQTIIREVNFNRITFYAVYERWANGGKFLSTVVRHPLKPQPEGAP